MADDTAVIDKPVEVPAKPPDTPAVPTPEPPSEAAETDAYIAERKERKRKERGGAQVRIDQLVKEKAELEKKLETKPVTEIPKAPEPPVVPPAAPPPVVPPVTPPAAATPPPEPVKKDIRPKPVDFAGDNAASEYDVALTQWVIRQQEKVKAKPVETPAAPAAPAVDPTRQAEFESFTKAVTTFTAEHPDYVESINAAVKRGIMIYDPAATAIMSLGAPHVAYWISRPENELAARRLSAMTAIQQVMEVARIDERLKAVNPKDFVSNAPPPGSRLTGSSFNGNFSLAELSDSDPEEYIRRRKLQKKEGRR